VSAPQLATVQISQIVVRRLFDCDNVYVFQNPDGRLIFASPYERDFTLIGSVSHPFKGDPAVVAIDVREVAYLCDAANRYFREQIAPVDVLRTVSGANSVVAPARRRMSDGAALLDVRRGKAPLLTIFGGDVTTARRRAERAVSEFTRFYPMTPRWTATAPLPGGEFAWQRFETEVEIARDRWRFLGEAQARRLVAAYGLILILSAIGYLILERALIAAEGDESKVKVAVGSKHKEWISIFGYGTAIGLAFVSPYIAVAIYVLVTAMWLIPDRRFEFWR